MKIRLLQVLLFGTLFVSLSSCLSKVVLEDDIILQQNETQIQQYISAKKLTTQKAINGVYYVIIKSNPSGRLMVLGDTVRLHYVISRLDGTKIDSSSVLKNQPFTFYNNLKNGNGGNTNIFLKMLPFMREGEQATFILPSTLAGDSQAFPNLPANSPVRCDISFMKIYSEEVTIDDYVAKNKIQLTSKDSLVSTLTGYTSYLRYIKVREGSADVITGKVAKLKYTGRLLNGFVFDSNISRTDSLNYTIGGTNSLVQGFAAGVAKMKLGEKATFIIPSGLGYGRTGSGNKIPGESTLIFDVEMVALKDK
jgi:FKBP-type peptidyl-prolyl cis-trans isomerase